MKQQILAIKDSTKLPLFSAPDKQVEKMEYASHMLDEINKRVNNAVATYNKTDEEIQLYDFEPGKPHVEDNIQALEESKGKVKVLIVDYDKLCMNRQEVLSSLKAWFEIGQAPDVYY